MKAYGIAVSGGMASSWQRSGNCEKQAWHERSIEEGKRKRKRGISIERNNGNNSVIKRREKQ